MTAFAPEVLKRERKTHSSTYRRVLLAISLTCLVLLLGSHTRFGAHAYPLSGDGLMPDTGEGNYAADISFYIRKYTLHLACCGDDGSSNREYSFAVVARLDDCTLYTDESDVNAYDRCTYCSDTCRRATGPFPSQSWSSPPETVDFTDCTSATGTKIYYTTTSGSTLASLEVLLGISINAWEDDCSSETTYDTGGECTSGPFYNRKTNNDDSGTVYWYGVGIATTDSSHYCSARSATLGYTLYNTPSRTTTDYQEHVTYSGASYWRNVKFGARWWHTLPRIEGITVCAQSTYGDCGYNDYQAIGSATVPTSGGVLKIVGHGFYDEQQATPVVYFTNANRYYLPQGGSPNIAGVVEYVSDDTIYVTTPQLTGEDWNVIVQTADQDQSGKQTVYSADDPVVTSISPLIADGSYVNDAYNSAITPAMSCFDAISVSGTSFGPSTTINQVTVHTELLAGVSCVEYSNSCRTDPTQSTCVNFDSNDHSLIQCIVCMSRADMQNTFMTSPRESRPLWVRVSVDEGEGWEKNSVDHSSFDFKLTDQSAPTWSNLMFRQSPGIDFASTPTYGRSWVSDPSVLYIFFVTEDVDLVDTSAPIVSFLLKITEPIGGVTAVAIGSSSDVDYRGCVDVTSPYTSTATCNYLTRYTDGSGTVNSNAQYTTGEAGTEAGLHTGISMFNDQFSFVQGSSVQVEATSCNDWGVYGGYCSSMTSSVSIYVDQTAPESGSVDVTSASYLNGADYYNPSSGLIEVYFWHTYVTSVPETMSYEWNNFVEADWPDTIVSYTAVVNQPVGLTTINIDCYTNDCVNDDSFRMQTITLDSTLADGDVVDINIEAMNAALLLADVYVHVGFDQSPPFSLPATCVMNDGTSRTTDTFATAVPSISVTATKCFMDDQSSPEYLPRQFNTTLYDLEYNIGIHKFMWYVSDDLLDVLSVGIDASSSIVFDSEYMAVDQSGTSTVLGAGNAFTHNTEYFSLLRGVNIAQLTSIGDEYSNGMLYDSTEPVVLEAVWGCDVADDPVMTPLTCETTFNDLLGGTITDTTVLQRILYDCPSDCVDFSLSANTPFYDGSARVFGNFYYTDTSKVCEASIHSGFFGDDGGQYIRVAFQNSVPAVNEREKISRRIISGTWPGAYSGHAFFFYDAAPVGLTEVVQSNVGSELCIRGVAFDHESLLASVQWIIGTAQGESDVMSSYSTGTVDGDFIQLSQTFATELDDGAYYATLKLTNTAGNSYVYEYTTPFIKDSTPPVSGIVVDGDRVANSMQDLRVMTGTDIAVSFAEFYDPETGIAEYLWGIGTDPDSDADLSFMNYTVVSGAVGNYLAYTTTELTRAAQEGVTYYSWIVAANGAALLSDPVRSSGILIDNTPPVASSITVLYADSYKPSVTLYQQSRRSIVCEWLAFEDDLAGIESYTFGVEDLLPTVSTLVPVQAVGTLTQHVSDLALADGDMYRCVVSAMDHAGLSTTAYSVDVVVDSTPPVVSSTNFITLSHRTTSSSEIVVDASWAGVFSEDTWSGIHHYEIDVGTTPYQSNLFSTNTTNDSTTDMVLSASDGLDIRDGTVIYVTVKAFNLGKVMSIASASPLLFDLSPPTGGLVGVQGVDGNGVDAAAVTRSSSTSDAQQVIVWWKGFSDPHSAIVGFRVSLTVTGSGAVTSPTDSMTDGMYSPALMDTTSYLTLPVDVTSLAVHDAFTVSVTAVDGAGLESSVTSLGSIVVSTAPDTGVVFIGDDEGQYSPYQTSTDHMTVSWTPFSDVIGPYLSGTSRNTSLHYVWAVGTSCFSDDIVPFTSVHDSTDADSILRYTASSLVLTSGTEYYAIVRATDAAGTPTENCSAAIMVDASAPLIGALSGSGAQVSAVLTYNEGDSCFDAAVEYAAISDPESGLHTVLLSIGGDSNGAHAGGSIYLNRTISVIEGSAGSVQIACAFTHASSGDEAASSSDLFVNLAMSNNAGLSTVVYDTVTYANVDLSNPNGLVIDGMEADFVDVDYQSDLHKISVQWVLPHTINASRITTWMWSVGTSISTQDGVSVYVNTLPFHEVLVHQTGLFSVNVDDIQLVTGERYHSCIKSYEGDDLVWLACSDGVTADATAPVTGTVTQTSCQGDEFDAQTCRNSFAVSWQASSSSVSASWFGFNDPDEPVDSSRSSNQGAISHYEVSVGSSRGATDVHPFTSVGVAQFATITNLNLIDGTSYYVTVRAYNLAGLSSLASSDGVVVDTTPPNAAGRILCDGSDDESLALPSEVSVSIVLSGLGDDESNIDSYVVSIGTSQLSSNVFGPEDLGAEASVIVTDSSSGVVSLSSSGHIFASGVTYHITVVAYNYAGLYTITQRTLLVDSSAPDTSFGHVRAIDPDTASGSACNSTLEVAYQQNESALAVCWSSLIDPESSIVMYEVAWGTGPYLTDVAPYVTALSGNSGDLDMYATHAYITDASSAGLVSGMTYYATVRVTNAAQLSSEATSAAVTIDNSAPRAGIVEDGIDTLTDTDYQAHTDLFTAHWDGFSEQHAPIVRYDVVANADGSPAFAVSDAVNVHMSTAAWLAGSSPVSDNTVRVEVTATTAAGFSVSSSSNGVYIDSSAPDTIPAAVANINNTLTVTSNVLTGAGYRDFQASHAAIEFEWLGVFSDSESSIQRYEWQVVMHSGGDQLMSAPVDVGLMTRATLTALSLVDGDEFTAKITAFNRAGLHTTLESEITMVDGSAPVGSLIYHPPQAESGVIVQASTTEVEVYWGTFSDSHTGIARFEVALGTEEEGSTDIAGYIVVDASLTYYKFTGLTLENGHAYYVTLRAYNLAGLYLTVVSTGVEPRTGTYVGDGITHDYDYQSSLTSITGNWGDFSGVVTSYVWSAGTHPGCTSMFTGRSAGLSTSITNNTVSLADDTTYCVAITGLSSGGSSTYSSDGFRTDSTAPVGGTVSPLFRGVATITSPLAGGFAIQWGDFEDAESGIAYYLYSVSTQSSTGVSPDVLPWKTVDATTTTAWVSDLEEVMQDGVTYYVFVRAVNGAGGRTTISSEFLIQDDPPFVAAASNGGIVYDGNVPGHDIFHQSNEFYLWANWDTTFTSERGTNTGFTYEWFVGTYPGGDDTLARTTAVSTAVCTNDTSLVTPLQPIDVGAINTTSSACMPPSITIQRTPVGSLEHGRTYYPTVVATNPAGLSTFATASGVVVDLTAPDIGEVYRGADPRFDEASSWDHSVLCAHWNGFQDLQSGIKQYTWSIEYRSPSGSSFVPLLNHTASGPGAPAHACIKPSALATPLGQFPAGSYRVHVLALNGVDMWSAEVISHTMLLDTSAPVIAAVVDGGDAQLHGSSVWAVDADYQTTTTALAFAWNTSDIESGISRIDYAIGTSPGGTQVVLFTTHQSNDDWLTVSGLELQNGYTYYVTLAVYNEVGLVASLSSDGVLVDDSVPLTGSIASSFDEEAETVTVESLTDFEDPDSGVALTEVALFSSPSTGALVLIAFTPAVASGSDVHEFDVSSVVAAGHTSAAVAARVTNEAGLSAIAFGDTLSILTGPVIIGAPELIGYSPEALVITGSQQVYQTSTEVLTGTWEACDGCSAYEVAFREVGYSGTPVAGSFEAQFDKFVSVGKTTSVRFEDLDLESGKEYECLVRTVSSSGVVSNTTTSNSITVDSTPPVVAAVNTTATYDRISASSVDVVFTWSNGTFSDVVSGIEEIQYAIGTSSGNTVLQTYIAVNTAEWSARRVETSFAVVAGEVLNEVWVSFYAVNEAGLSTFGSVEATK